MISGTESVREPPVWAQLLYCGMDGINNTASSADNIGMDFEFIQNCAIRMD